MHYSIGAFAKLTGLGIHTLRYYEHEKLIAPERNAGNRRSYSDKDRIWIDFIKRLKDTGMSIKEIKRYAQLRAIGEATLNERLALLLRHRQDLNGRILQLQEHQAKLDQKIAFYRKEITRKQSKLTPERGGHEKKRG